MKLFKKIFGSENKKTKYESNTLAEINESPDRSKEDKAPAVEPKKETATTKKASAATKTEAKATKPAPKKATAPAEESAPKEVKPAAKKATSTAPKKEAPTTAKSATEAPKAETKKVVATAKTTDKSKEKVAKTEDKEKKSAASTKVETETKADKVEENAPTDAPQKNAKSGKFEIKKSKDGRYVFNLYASNNVIVATSQVYSSSSSAMNGIKSVITNAPTAPIEDQTLKSFEPLSFPKWEIYRDKGDQYRFRLSASNGSCVCHSQGYTSKANCKKGIESIIKFAAGADITKAYLNKDN